MGAEIAPDLYECELEYLYRHEWALTAEDVLWRRTKLGLRYDSSTAGRVERWLHDRCRGAERFDERARTLRPATVHSGTPSP